MDRKGKEIDISERKIMIKLWKDGQNYRQIGRTVGRSWTSVRTVFQSFEKSRNYYI